MNFKSPEQNNKLPSDWLKRAAKEASTFLQKDYEEQMKVVVQEKMVVLEEMKKEAFEKLKQLEEETRKKIEEANNIQDADTRDDTLEGIKEEYELMKKRYLNWTS